MTTNLDLAGNVLIVEDIRVGATQTGQAGSAIAGNTDTPEFDSIKLGTLSIAATAGAATAAGGDAATAGASHVIPIDINGTTYYILLTDDNET